MTAIGGGELDKIFNEHQERAMGGQALASSPVHSYQRASEDGDQLHLLQSFGRLRALSRDGGNPHVSNILKNEMLRASLGATIEEQQRRNARRLSNAGDPRLDSQQEQQESEEMELHLENLYEVTDLVREGHQIPHGAFARMITFKEMLDRGQN